MRISKLFKIITVTTLAGIMFIGCGEKVTFKGQDYKVITSPITGKKWLDRNLGASQACTSSTDKACYGDYYQWGRLADGHEKASSSLTTSRVNDVSDIGNKFVAKYKDWTFADNEGSVRKVQWAKIDGTGVCPVGFRVPTQTELRAETIGYFGSDNTSTGAVKVIDSATAFQNFLKLPVAGIRTAFDGSIMNQNSIGFLWTIASNEDKAQLIGYGGIAQSAFDERAMGLSVRCIESKTSDVTDTIPPQITSASSYSVPENKISSFTIVANDDSDITYSIRGEDSFYFSIDSSTGIVTFKIAPDYETKNSYNLIVEATDSQYNKSSKEIVVNIIDDINEIKIVFNNLQYEIVTSPITGRKWLDRNLGATQSCISPTNKACYGDYYQWGRLSDGHEKVDSNISSIQASSILNAGNSFIIGSEWINNNSNDNREEQWSKIDGTSICPVGFRVPTQDELDKESGYTFLNSFLVNSGNSNNNSEDFLKIALAGVRNDNGTLKEQNLLGSIWTSKKGGEYSGGKNHHYGPHSTYGIPVRCIEGIKNF